MWGTDVAHFQCEGIGNHPRIVWRELVATWTDMGPDNCDHIFDAIGNLIIVVPI
jgi:hypothetical protein